MKTMDKPWTTTNKPWQNRETTMKQHAKYETPWKPCKCSIDLALCTVVIAATLCACPTCNEQRNVLSQLLSLLTTLWWPITNKQKTQPICKFLQHWFQDRIAARTTNSDQQQLVLAPAPNNNNCCWVQTITSSSIGLAGWSRLNLQPHAMMYVHIQCACTKMFSAPPMVTCSRNRSLVFDSLGPKGNKLS